MKLFRPWVFQGSLSRKYYFEGWYFKHVSADREQVWSFIPGVSLAPEGRQALYEKQKKILNFFLKSIIYCKTSKQYHFRLNKISWHYYLLGSLALELGKFSDAVEKYFKNSLVYKFNFTVFKHLLIYRIIGKKNYITLYKIKSSIGKHQKT